MPRKSKPKSPRHYGDGRRFLRGKRWYVEYRGKVRATHSTEEAESIALLGELMRQHARGEFDPGGKDQYTVGDLLDEYMKRKKLALGTAATYKSQIKLHLKPFFGLLPLSKLTSDILSDYREMRERQEVQQGSNAKRAVRKERRKVDSTSVNRELALLRASLKDLARRRPKAVPAIPYFPMQRENNVRQGFITEERFVEKLFPELPRHWQCPAVCAFWCGGRKGEWANCDWDEVDFENMLIYFPESKNKRPREVPIFPGLMLETLLEAKRIRDTMWPEQKAVFLYDGKRFKLGGSAWEKACKRAGFPGLLFHDMRRSASKGMRDAGIPQRVRMQIMGHQTPSMDIRYGMTDKENIDIARDLRSRKSKKCGSGGDKVA